MTSGPPGHPLGSALPTPSCPCPEPGNQNNSNREDNNTSQRSSTNEQTGQGHTTRPEGGSNNGQGTKVIGKVNDLNKPGALRPGESKLDLPNKGNPKANWEQNSGKLREAMKEGNPIRDVSGGPRDANGQLPNNTGFLKAERNLLQSKGWHYDEGTSTWNPPQK